jgi:hypothetical protein
MQRCTHGIVFGERRRLLRQIKAFHRDALGPYPIEISREAGELRIDRRSTHTG